MKRSASEIINDLEGRISQLEKNAGKFPPKAIDLNKVTDPDGFWDMSLSELKALNPVLRSNHLGNPDTKIADIIMFLNMATIAWEKPHSRKLNKQRKRKASKSTLRVSVEITEEEFDFELEETEFTTTAKKTFDDIDKLVSFLERGVRGIRDGYEELVDAMKEHRKIRSLEVGKLYKLSTREDDGLVVHAHLEIEKADNSSLEELDEAIFDLVR